MTHLFIRADVGNKIGTGHVMRCLALAQVWQDNGGKVTFVMADSVPAIDKRLTDEGIKINHIVVEPGGKTDADQTLAIAAELGAGWLVVDGYDFNADYQKALKGAGLKLLFIDDYGHAEHYFADIILNQNLYASKELYIERESYTKLLLGPKYVLLRREFLKYSNWRRTINKEAKNILVTLGGSDPDNVTEKVIKALSAIKDVNLDVIVVIGGANNSLKELQEVARDSCHQVRLEQNVTNMPKLMAWADIAISAGGTTCLELAFMRLPFIALVLAENQRDVAENLGKKRVAMNLGWYADISISQIYEEINFLITNLEFRWEMSNICRDLIGGGGAQKVIRNLIPERIMKLRKVKIEDNRLLWEWANDPAVRSRSFTTEPIPWENHIKWFSKKLNDPNCLQFMALDDEGKPLGQIRFDLLNANEAEISLSIDRNKRGLGYSDLIINRATEEVFRIKQLKSVHAFIKPENRQSIRSFERANFEKVGSETVKNQLAVHYIKYRNNIDDDMAI